MATIATISDLIIPADEHSPGAKATGIAAFIDLMISESPDEVKALWRNAWWASNMSQQVCDGFQYRRRGAANLIAQGDQQE
jgi:hypothetical protein